MYRRLAVLLVVVAATAAPVAQSGQQSPLTGLQTRAERSNFTETSRYDDVQRFLATVERPRTSST